jgi:apolipoprotein N-acyltransferase
MARMRALETGRPFLRAANTGVSAIIDSRGRVTARAPQFERTVLEGTVQPTAGVTPFVRFGHLPVLMLIGVLLGAAWLATRRKAPPR